MKYKALTAAALALGLAAPASADPLIGFGLSFAFGGGGTDVGVGLRVFSDDEEDSTVASVGMDYLFTSQSWRATAGVAQLMDGSYIGADVGVKLNGGGFDAGLSLGAADTEDDAPAAPPPPPIDQGQPKPD